MYHMMKQCQLLHLESVDVTLELQKSSTAHLPTNLEGTWESKQNMNNYIFRVCTWLCSLQNITVDCNYTWQSCLTNDTSKQRELLQSSDTELLRAQQGLNGVCMDY